MKRFIQTYLERAVSRYFKKNPHVVLIVVAGSVGKTSTKMAIGTVLSQKMKVRLHEGNHNSELSAPLAILGVEFPENLRSIGAWWRVFWAVKRRLRELADVDVIVQELGTDGVGQLPHFGTYLKPDIAVVTAVSPEHMEFFKTLDAVATEELSVVNFSTYAFINRDDVPGKYADSITNADISTYGTIETAEYRFITNDYTFEDGFSGMFFAGEHTQAVSTTLHTIGEHSIRSAVVAGAIALRLGFSVDETAKAMEYIKPVRGRMNILRGMNNSVLLDDTYNSSPLAAEAALRALYQINAVQKIAVLGSMNELGESSAAEHETLGKLCDPVQLNHVITVGKEAELYLAPAARANGCHVVSFTSALEAGAAVHAYLEEGTVVLFKGSQGGIYLEEAVKVVLHSTEDEAQLVRQSTAWREKKQRFFSSLTN